MWTSSVLKLNTHEVEGYLRQFDSKGYVQVQNHLRKNKSCKSTLLN